MAWKWSENGSIYNYNTVNFIIEAVEVYKHQWDAKEPKLPTQPKVGSFH